MDDRLKCKACGCYSLMPVDLEPDAEDDASYEVEPEQESRFFSCHVCGDNWLSLREVRPSGDCTLTFVHQMGIQPTLKRVAHLGSAVVLAESVVDRWDYYFGDDAVDEGDWRAHLARRRNVLRAICTN